MNMAIIKALPTNKRLSIALEKAAKLLPAQTGQQLLAFATPAAIGTMVTVLSIWAGSHLFGVGEIADIAILVLGYAALGSTAIEAARHISSVSNTNRDQDLDEAARHLAEAITLIGVQFVLGMLLRKPPKEILTPTTRYVPPIKTVLKAEFPKNSHLYNYIFQQTKRGKRSNQELVR